MKLSSVVLYVPDVAAAAAFYERAFGLRLRHADPNGEFGEMETGGIPLVFVAEGRRAEAGHTFRAHRPFEQPAATEVGFVAQDVAAAYDDALRAGALPYEAPNTRSDGQTVAYVRDLNGVLVEIRAESCVPEDDAWRLALRG
ncbi:MAG TPA: VOC family protein [Roseiarcus sp.]|nr:VOC family protein [Roseiarcus sp.]